MSPCPFRDRLRRTGNGFDAPRVRICCIQVCYISVLATSLRKQESKANTGRLSDVFAVGMEWGASGALAMMHTPLGRWHVCDLMSCDPSRFGGIGVGKSFAATSSTANCIPPVGSSELPTCGELGAPCRGTRHRGELVHLLLALNYRWFMKW